MRHAPTLPVLTGPGAGSELLDRLELLLRMAQGDRPRRAAATLRLEEIEGTDGDTALCLMASDGTMVAMFAKGAEATAALIATLHNNVHWLVPVARLAVDGAPATIALSHDRCRYCGSDKVARHAEAIDTDREIIRTWCRDCDGEIEAIARAGTLGAIELEEEGAAEPVA